MKIAYPPESYYIEPTPPPDYTEEDSPAWDRQFDTLFELWLDKQPESRDDTYADGFPEEITTALRKRFEGERCDHIQEAYLQWLGDHYSGDYE